MYSYSVFPVLEGWLCGLVIGASQAASRIRIVARAQPRPRPSTAPAVSLLDVAHFVNSTSTRFRCLVSPLLAWPQPRLRLSTAPAAVRNRLAEVKRSVTPRMIGSHWVVEIYPVVVGHRRRRSDQPLSAERLLCSRRTTPPQDTVCGRQRSEKLKPWAQPRLGLSTALAGMAVNANTNEDRRNFLFLALRSRFLQPAAPA